MSKKKKCCKSYKKNGKPCKSCPLMKTLGKKERAVLLQKYV